MKKEVAKSPEILAKEATIKELQTKLKKKKTVLKSLKTRLANTKEKITEVQRTATGKVASKMEQMEQLRVEILDLVERMKKMKGLSKADKAALKDMANEFANEDMFGEDYKAYKEQMEDLDAEDFSSHFDENERAKMRDLFETFAVKPDKQEQKDIRKIFIGLSQKFHPDKATTKAEEEEYHQMMQQINQAYQAGDIQTLLELEQLFITENLDLNEAKSFSVDVLQQEIDRLERDLQFIENQIERNSAELKNLRSSDFGRMLTELKRAESQGQGLDAAFGDLEESIRRMEQLRDAFTECLEVGNIKPLEAMMQAEQLDRPGPEQMLEMLSELSGGKVSPEDIASMFGFSEDADPFGFGQADEVKNPKFPEGTSVKIAKNTLDEITDLPIGGLIGRVESVYYGEGKWDILYEIELDSLSLDKIPADYIRALVEDDEDFQNFEFSESQLRRCRPRDKREDAQIKYKTLFNEYRWNYLENAAAKQRLKGILLRFIELDDSENWRLFLSSNLKFPLKTQSRGMMDFPEGGKITITELAGINHEVGIIANVMYRKKPGTYPLFDLVPAARNPKLRQIFDDYLIWAEDMYNLDVYMS
ncbi:MAG: calcium-binding protein [Bacteroidota bacterium]